MIEEIEGIVLKQTEYKENDCILSVLTASGKETFYAKGIKKPTSKNSFGCSALSFSRFQYDKKEHGMSSLRTVTTIKNYIANFDDYDKIMIASIMAQMMDEISVDESQNAQILFQLLSNGLDALGTYTNYYLVLAIFLTSVLQELGISLIVDECSGCGLSQINAISIEAGGFVCQECLKHVSSKQYDKKFLQQFRFVNKAELQHIPTLIEYGPYPKELILLLKEFITQYAGISNKSFKFLKDLPDYD